MGKEKGERQTMMDIVENIIFRLWDMDSEEFSVSSEEIEIKAEIEEDAESGEKNVVFQLSTDEAIMMLAGLKYLSEDIQEAVQEMEEEDKETNDG